MPSGCYVSTLPSLSVVVSQYGTGFFTAKKAMTIMVAQNESDLAWMTSRIEAGKIKVMIGRVYPLEQAKEALAHSEAGKARGKIVLKMI
jgi:NADPH:quinone reductase-like Zn-dependent oxidoreductase